MMSESTDSNGKVILAIKGDFDTKAAPKIDGKLSECVNRTDDLVLDFKDVSYVSSAGLRVILKIQKAMEEKNGRITFINVCDEVLDVFEFAGFLSILTIE